MSFRQMLAEYLPREKLEPESSLWVRQVGHPFQPRFCRGSFLSQRRECGLGGGEGWRKRATGHQDVSPHSGSCGPTTEQKLGLPPLLGGQPGDHLVDSAGRAAPGFGPPASPPLGPPAGWLVQASTHPRPSRARRGRRSWETQWPASPSGPAAVGTCAHGRAGPLTWSRCALRRQVRRWTGGWGNARSPVWRGSLQNRKMTKERLTIDFLCTEKHTGVQTEYLGAQGM